MLKFYNTLTRKKDVFHSIEKNKVKLYTCGPTVYNYAHIGNLRSYIFEDVLKRTLLANDFQVNHVMNITDVGHLTSDADEGEDKMEKSATAQDKTVWEIAEFYTKAFKANMKDLNLLEPDTWAKATDHIPEQIDWIKKLEKKGFTYQISDGIYFDTSKLNDYGKLTGQKLSELQEGARVEKNEEKRNATDFALWKFSPKDTKRQMEWESPWGIGFPGWHLECSVMAAKYLGEHFDIHCGGIDHIPVHHTNEIAQTEAVTGKQFVNYWMHNEFLVMDPLGENTFTNFPYTCPECDKKFVIKTEKEFNQKVDSEGNTDLYVECPHCKHEFSGLFKMAKSLKFITLEDLKKQRFNPLAYRYFVLGTHYRKKLSFSWEALKAAQNALDNLTSFSAEYGKPKIGCAEFEQKFMEAINDDLNTPKALAVVWDLLKSNYPPEAKKASLLKFDKVLGLDLAQAKQLDVSNKIKELVTKRTIARTEKDYNQADELRKQIENDGFKVEDTPAGPVIKKK